MITIFVNEDNTQILIYTNKVPNELLTALRFFMLSWRNWNTHTLQERMPIRLVGSNPTESIVFLLAHQL